MQPRITASLPQQFAYFFLIAPHGDRVWSMSINFRHVTTLIAFYPISGSLLATTTHQNILQMPYQTYKQVY